MQPKIKNKEKTQHATVEILDPCDDTIQIEDAQIWQGTKTKIGSHLNLLTFTYSKFKHCFLRFIHIISNIVTMEHLSNYRNEISTAELYQN
jgi:hypothetical protein